MGLFVDEAGDTLDTTTASKTTDSRLQCRTQLVYWITVKKGKRNTNFGDALDIVTKNLAVTLSSTPKILAMISNVARAI